MRPGIPNTEIDALAGALKGGLAKISNGPLRT